MKFQHGEEENEFSGILRAKIPGGHFLAVSTKNPTEHLTNLEPQNPWINFS